MASTSIEPQVSRQRLVEWVQRMVRHPSPWSPRLEDDPAVRAFVAECGGSLAGETGLKTRYDPMGNMLIELGRRDASRHLLFVAYAMTHPASNMTSPFAGERVTVNGRDAIRGRGVSEQKAAAAAAFAAVYARTARGPVEGALTFVLCTSGETGRHRAVECLLSHLDPPPTLAILAIGSSRRVALGNKGRYDIDITVRGRAGHSSAPWAAVDAIAGAARVLEQFDALELGAEPHPDLGSPTLTPTAIESFPKASHTVQGEVRMTFDLRILPGQDPEAAFDAVAQSATLPEAWGLEIRKGAFQYPCEIRPDSEPVRHIRRGHTAAGLAQPQLFYSHAALDSGYLTANGCPATMWGPGDIAMFHTDDESVPVDDVWEVSNAYLGTIESYLD